MKYNRMWSWNILLIQLILSSFVNQCQAIGDINDLNLYKGGFELSARFFYASSNLTSRTTFILQPDDTYRNITSFGGATESTKTNALGIDQVLFYDYFAPQKEDSLFNTITLIFIHGGNYENGYANNNCTYYQFEEWVKQGFHAISIEYRRGWISQHNSSNEALQENMNNLENATKLALQDIQTAWNHYDNNVTYGHGRWFATSASSSYILLGIDCGASMIAKSILTTNLDIRSTFEDVSNIEILGIILGFGSLDQNDRLISNKNYSNDIPVIIVTSMLDTMYPFYDNYLFGGILEYDDYNNYNRPIAMGTMNLYEKLTKRNYNARILISAQSGSQNWNDFGKNPNATEVYCSSTSVFGLAAPTTTNTTIANPIATALGYFYNYNTALIPSFQHFKFKLNTPIYISDNKYNKTNTSTYTYIYPNVNDDCNNLNYINNYNYNYSYDRSVWGNLNSSNMSNGCVYEYISYRDVLTIDPSLIQLSNATAVMIDGFEYGCDELNGLGFVNVSNGFRYEPLQTEIENLFDSNRNRYSQGRRTMRDILAKYNWFGIGTIATSYNKSIYYQNDVCCIEYDFNFALYNKIRGAFTQTRIFTSLYFYTYFLIVIVMMMFGYQFLGKVRLYVTSYMMLQDIESKLEEVTIAIKQMEYIQQGKINIDSNNDKSFLTVDNIKGLLKFKFDEIHDIVDNHKQHLMDKIDSIMDESVITQRQQQLVHKALKSDIHPASTIRTTASNDGDGIKLHVQLASQSRHGANNTMVYSSAIATKVQATMLLQPGDRNPQKREKSPRHKKISSQMATHLFPNRSSSVPPATLLGLRKPSDDNMIIKYADSRDDNYTERRKDKSVAKLSKVGGNLMKRSVSYNVYDETKAESLTPNVNSSSNVNLSNSNSDDGDDDKENKDNIAITMGNIVERVSAPASLETEIGGDNKINRPRPLVSSKSHQYQLQKLASPTVNIDYNIYHVNDNNKEKRETDDDNGESITKIHAAQQTEQTTTGISEKEQKTTQLKLDVDNEESAEAKSPTSTVGITQVAINDDKDDGDDFDDHSGLKKLTTIHQNCDSYQLRSYEAVDTRLLSYVSRKLASTKSLNQAIGILKYSEILFQIRSLLWAVCSHFFDTATDIALIWEWYDLYRIQSEIKQELTSDNCRLNDEPLFNVNMAIYWICGLVSLIYYRLCSTYQVWQFTHSKSDAILQFLFDFYLIKLVYYNIIKMQSPKKLELVSIMRGIEGSHESVYQAILTMAFLLEIKFAGEYASSVSIISLLFSFYSLTTRFIFLDKYNISENARKLGITSYHWQKLFTTKNGLKHFLSQLNGWYLFHTFYRSVEIFFSILLWSLGWILIDALGLIVLFWFLVPFVVAKLVLARNTVWPTDWLRFLMVDSINDDLQNRSCVGLTQIFGSFALNSVRVLMCVVLAATHDWAHKRDSETSTEFYDIFLIVLFILCFIVIVGKIIAIKNYAIRTSVISMHKELELNMNQFIALNNKECLLFAFYLNYKFIFGNEIYSQYNDNYTHRDSNINNSTQYWYMKRGMLNKSSLWKNMCSDFCVKAFDKELRMHSDIATYIMLCEDSEIYYFTKGLFNSIHKIDFDTYLAQTCNFAILLADKVIVNNLDSYKKLYNKGVSINAKHVISQQNILHYACKAARLDIVEWILGLGQEESGIDINETDDDGYSSLHFLMVRLNRKRDEKRQRIKTIEDCSNDEIQIARLLVANGIDQTIKNASGNTAQQILRVIGLYGALINSKE